MALKHFAAITSDGHRGVLEGMLPPDTLYCVESNPNVRGKLAEWEAQNVDVVIVDDDGMPYKDVSENDLYTYPATARRKMQIIFIPSAARDSSDPFLSKLVSVGIYDIVNPRLAGDAARKEIARMIERPSMFADAVRYFDESASPVNNGKQKRSRRGRIRMPFGRNEEAVVDRGSMTNGRESIGERVVSEKQESANEGEAMVERRSGESLEERLAAIAMGRDEGVVSDTAPSLTGRESPQPESKKPDQLDKSDLLQRLKGVGIEDTEPPSNASEDRKPEPVEKPLQPDPGERGDSRHEGKNEPENIEAIADLVYERVLEKLSASKLVDGIQKGEACERRTEETRAGRKRKGTKTICFAEVYRGAGSAEAALGCAFFIARRWPTQTVAVELTDRAKLNALLKLSGDGERLKYNGVTIGMLGDRELSSNADWIVKDCDVLNYSVESKARSAFMTGSLKCMVVPSEPWQMTKIKEIIEKYKAEDRVTWTWCFNGGSKEYVDKVAAFAGGAKSQKVRYYRLPYDPDYFYGASQVDYYDLIRPLLTPAQKSNEKQA